MIFIREIATPLMYADCHGFLDEMQSFMDAFLDIDHYELTGGIFTTSYAPANTDVRYHLRYINNTPVNDIEPLMAYATEQGIDLAEAKPSTWGWYGRRHFDTVISLADCLDSLVSEGGPRRIPDGFGSAVVEQNVAEVIHRERLWITKQRLEHALAERRSQRREQAEYAAALPEACPRASKFMGMRELSIDCASASTRDELNGLLHEFYDRFGRKLTSHDVYHHLQHIDEYVAVDPDDVLRNLERRAKASGCRRCDADTHDRYWGRFTVERHTSDPGYSDLALVKVYLSLDSVEEILACFESVVAFLIDEGTHRFHAKVTRQMRSDQICLWVAREDFFALERFLERWNDALRTPLSFVAYRNKMGVSRELATWDSHNSIQADLIAGYIKGIADPARIDVLDMYAQYVRAWSGDMIEYHPLTKAFKQANAQEFLILLESLDVILENSAMGDDHFLLTGDDDLMRQLSDSRNWYQLGEEIMNPRRY